MSWIDAAYMVMRRLYHITDNEFWHETSIARLTALMPMAAGTADDGQDMAAITAAGL